MILSMAFFALEDSFIKLATETLPSGQVFMLFGLGGALFFLTGLVVRNEPVLGSMHSPVMRVRMLFEVFGRMFYFLALALTPLSSTTAILQATPVVVVLGAALFFGERVGIKRWLAICTGLVGVMIILKPTADSFSTLSLLAVLGMLGFAGRDLASRAAPLSLSAYALGFYGFVAVIIAGAIVSLWSGSTFIWPDLTTCFYLIGSVIVGIIAYTALMKAMRTGEVSSVTPFRYSRLLFGIGLGYLIFNEPLDPSIWLGSGIIVASGLFIMWR